MPRVFDCFMAWKEADMWEARFNILRDAVDFHVVVEAGQTHSGHPKPSWFQEQLDSGRFDAFRDKILYGYVPQLRGDDSWARERYHRGAIAWLLATHAADDDLIIVGDADEIPRPEIIPLIGDGARLELDFYYYDVNHRVQEGWSIGALRWGAEKNPNKIRTLAGHDVPRIEAAGWHFSYFLPPEQVVQKLDDFMHHDDIAANVPRDPEWLGTTMAAGQDIIGRGLPIERVPLSDTLPRYLLDNQDKYRALGWI